MNKIIFVTGGSKSGKSYFAEKLALSIQEKNINKNIAYIATSDYFDEEMKKKISLHKKRRGKNFSTYEENLFIDEKIKKIFNEHDVFLIECITTWLGNIMHKKKSNIEKISFDIINNLLMLFENFVNRKNNENFFKKLKSLDNKKFKFKTKDLIKNSKKGKFLIIVSSEVNQGIIPENKLARDYINLLGKLNQFIAEKAQFSYLLVSGNPLRIK
jgi:adenosylcobinamide kinase / adenosylcobinamide-phosphate guanylyltransferase